MTVYSIIFFFIIFFWLMILSPNLSSLDTNDAESLINSLVTVHFSGATLEIITDRSQEGSQFCKGFGGIGGILRYRVEFQNLEYDSDGLDGYDDY